MERLDTLSPALHTPLAIEEDHQLSATVAVPVGAVARRPVSATPGLTINNNTLYHLAVVDPRSLHAHLLSRAAGLFLISRWLCCRDEAKL
tara:strand:- start:1204 stop:1473 length:270 start_codon:yes stop_codon:yes gene_type:complete